jgi:hypothetical protein
MMMGVLAATLGLVGCGSSSSNTGGSGGQGGSGGSGGSGGTPMLSACSSGPLAETGETGSAALACVATLPFDLTLSFNATPVNPVQVGENEFVLQVEVAIDAATVNTVVDLAQVVDVLGVFGTVSATADGSALPSADVVDEGVPCSLMFVRDEDAVIVTSVTNATWTLGAGETLELTLGSITQEVEALGLPVTLTTEGAEPSCTFVDVPPSVQFTAP